MKSSPSVVAVGAALHERPHVTAGARARECGAPADRRTACASGRPPRPAGRARRHHLAPKPTPAPGRCPGPSSTVSEGASSEGPRPAPDLKCLKSPHLDPPNRDQPGRAEPRARRGARLHRGGALIVHKFGSARIQRASRLRAHNGPETAPPPPPRRPSIAISNRRGPASRRLNPRPTESRNSRAHS